MVQIILERIETPVVQKLQDLDDINWGARVFESTNVQSQGQPMLGSQGSKKKKETQSPESRMQQW